MHNEGLMIIFTLSKYFILFQGQCLAPFTSMFHVNSSYSMLRVEFYIQLITCYACAIILSFIIILLYCTSFQKVDSFWKTTSKMRQTSIRTAFWEPVMFANCKLFIPPCMPQHNTLQVQM